MEEGGITVAARARTKFLVQGGEEGEGGEDEREMEGFEGGGGGEGGGEMDKRGAEGEGGREEVEFGEEQEAGGGNIVWVGGLSMTISSGISVWGSIATSLTEAAVADSGEDWVSADELGSGSCTVTTTPVFEPASFAPAVLLTGTHCLLILRQSFIICPNSLQ